MRCVQKVRDLPAMLAAAGDLSKITMADADRILAQQGPGACWNRFWAANQIMFVLSVAGAGLLLVGLMTCCCFCCAEKPAKTQIYPQQQVGPCCCCVVVVGFLLSFLLRHKHYSVLHTDHLTLRPTLQTTNAPQQQGQYVVYPDAGPYDQHGYPYQPKPGMMRY